MADDSDTPRNALCAPCRGVQERCADFGEFCHEVGDLCKSVNYKGCLKNMFSLENLRNKFPIVKWLPKYRCRYLQGDIIAGLTVGLTVIPQGLAYAQVAELSPEVGLYTAFISGFIYMIFGTSKDLTLGPTAVMALLTATFSLSPVDKDPTIAVILTLFTGIIQLVMGLISFGFLLHFIPYPVINGFTTAAAITIAVGQTKKWLGLKGIPRQFIPQVIGILKSLPKTRLPDFGMGVVVMITVIIMKKLKQRKFDLENAPLPKIIAVKVLFYVTTARNAIVIAIAGGVAAAVNSDDKDPFTLTGNITGGLPDFKLPDFHLQVDNATSYGPLDILSHIGSGLLIVPIIGVVESIAIANSYARLNKYKLDFNQELIANGACNFLGAFVGAYPVSGSFARTALNSQSGVKTPVGGIFTGGLVLLALGVLTPLFYYIPDAALACVIIPAVLDTASFYLPKKLWRIKKADLIPWFVTFIMSFVKGVEYGIILGVVVSQLFLLYPWARPRVKRVGDGICVIEIYQGLRFPGVEYVTEKVSSIATAGDKTISVVLDCLYLSDLDYSAVQGLQTLLTEFHFGDAQLVIARARPPVQSILDSANIKDLHCFVSIEEAVHHIKDTQREKSPDKMPLANDTADLTSV